jgi:hypothetical protein
MSKVLRASRSCGPARGAYDCDRIPNPQRNSQAQIQPGEKTQLVVRLGRATDTRSPSRA